jgi:PPM family protein phosphatase
VGAVAEHPHALADQRHLQTPAGRAAELGRGVPQQPPAPDGSFGPPDSGDPALGAAPLGSFGPPAEGGHAKPKPRRAWLKRTSTGILVLAVVGGGLYAGYRWTQTQYFVGANGDHVAVYQGIDQSLLGLKLSQVHQDHPEIPLKYLPTYQRDQVKNTIAVNNLPQAVSKTDELHKQAAVCEVVAQNAKSGHPSGTSAKPGASTSPSPGASASTSATTHTDASAAGKPSTTPSATPSPSATLSAEEQKLAQQCGTGQQ